MLFMMSFIHDRGFQDWTLAEWIPLNLSNCLSNKLMNKSMSLLNVLIIHCSIFATRTLTRGGSSIPRRRGRQPFRRGHQHTKLPDFPKNCMKLRKFWFIGGACAGGAPLDPQLLTIRQVLKSFKGSRLFIWCANYFVENRGFPYKRL